MPTRERFSLAKPLNEHGQWLQRRIQTPEDEGKDLEGSYRWSCAVAQKGQSLAVACA